MTRRKHRKRVRSKMKTMMMKTWMKKKCLLRLKMKMIRKATISKRKTMMKNLILMLFWPMISSNESEPFKI